MEDRSAGLNGYKIRSYGDLVAVATLLALFVGVLAWGLKLEARLDVVRDEMMRMNRAIAPGVLPRAEERIDSLQRELGDIRNELASHEANDHP